MVSIPNFDLIKPIGKGAYGEVWLARDVNHLRTARYRAVKIVSVDADEEGKHYQREYEGVEQYEPISREHVGLVDVLQVGLQEGFFFYVMELADDCDRSQEINPETYTPRTLQHELKTRDSLPFDECITVARALAEGLAFLHGRNLVHRDIKPTNIIRVNGLWKYADTGLVTDADVEKTQVGTPGYLPPEGSGKPAADIFSLGKVLYQICTGMESAQFPDLPASFPGMKDPLFKGLNEIYLKACEYNLESRYKSATEIINELALLAESVEDTIGPDPGDLVLIAILDEAAKEVARHSLGQGEHIIGRKGHGNEVTIDDKSVSRKHAKLVVAEDGNVEMEDLKSTFGISKDGTQIKGRVHMNPGEKIKLGRHFIQLMTGNQTIGPNVETKKTLGDGRYTFLRRLGHGSIGEVWHMWDNELEEDVAAKLLIGNMMDEFSVAAIKREVNKTRKLAHENIVRIHDFCSFPDDPPFLSMEFVDGHTLETHRTNREGHVFLWEELKPLMDQLCNAVAYIHEKGIVHRDIKPTNILLSNDGQVKLGDFGCARSMIISRFTVGQYAEKGEVGLAGTLFYMSPQMLEGADPRAADDIYAIGVILYELLVGQMPFTWKQSTNDLIEQIRNANPIPPDDVFVQNGMANPIPRPCVGSDYVLLEQGPRPAPCQRETDHGNSPIN
jgi:serine/threonine protein kinase